MQTGDDRPEAVRVVMIGEAGDVECRRRSADRQHAATGDLVARRLVGQATFIEDSAASNGVTARMVGDRVSWWVQFDFSALPDEGEWSVYVALRADIDADADPEATALQLGVYPTIGASSRWNYPASVLIDGQYHEVHLPGTYQSEDSDRYFFVTGVVNPAVPHLYVDRLFAVRA